MASSFAMPTTVGTLPSNRVSFHGGYPSAGAAFGSLPATMTYPSSTPMMGTVTSPVTTYPSYPPRSMAGVPSTLAPTAVPVSYPTAYPTYSNTISRVGTVTLPPATTNYGIPQTMGMSYGYDSGIIPQTMGTSYGGPRTLPAQLSVPGGAYDNVYAAAALADHDDDDDNMDAVIEQLIEEEELKGGDDLGYWKFKDVQKPRTKWRSGYDVAGDWPYEHPQASTDAKQKPQDLSLRMIQHMKSYHETRSLETSDEMARIQEDKPWPFWVGVGTPAARVEPTWIDGAWYLVAPVDFKGIEKLPKDLRRKELATVDRAIAVLDEQDRVPKFPPPRHWKEHKNCPIA